MLAVHAAVLLGAHAILRRAATGNGAIDLVLFLLLRFAILSAAVLLAGWTGLLRPLPLGIAGLAALGGLILLGEHRAIRRPALPDFGRILPLLAAVVLLRLLVQVWFFAPYTMDALSYHLTKVPEWVRAGGFTREMGVDTHAPFPAGFELVETAWVVFLHHDVLIEMAGVEFLALGAAATFALARSAGLSDRSAFFAALLYVLTPGVHVSATSCLNDVPVAALVLAAAALLAARAPHAWALLAFGLGIGIKPTFGYALPGLLLLGLLVRKKPPLEARGPRWAAGLAALGLAVGLSWYLRNLAWYGNPIHPVGTKGLINSLGYVQIQFGPSFSSGYRNLIGLIANRVYDDHIGYASHLTHTSGWGAMGFACGFLGLLVALRQEPRLRPLFLGLTASLLGVLFLVNHDPWCARFVLFYPALLSIAVAWVAERLRPVLWVAGAALAYQFLATHFPLDLPFPHARTLAGMGWRQRSMARVFQAESKEPAIAYYVREPVHNRGESYLLYGPDYSRRVVYLRGSTADQVAAEMERDGVRRLYSARRNPPGDPVLADSLRRKLLEWPGGRFFVRP